MHSDIAFKATGNRSFANFDSSVKHAALSNIKNIRPLQSRLNRSLNQQIVAGLDLARQRYTGANCQTAVR